MNITRAKEILNNIVNYVAVANDTNDQIEELLKYGFEPSELVSDFGYSKADVEYVTGDSCDVVKEEHEPKSKPILGAFVLITRYFFDSDMSVWLFATEEEAKAELKRQFEEELRVQTEENKHVAGKDLETEYTDEWDFASITTYTGSAWNATENETEWKVSQVRTDKGVGSEISVPAKDE